MNRRGLKDASRQCLRDTHSHPKSVTLLFLLAALVIAGLDTGLGTLLQQTAGKSHSLSQSISATYRYRMAQYVLLDNPQLSIRQVLARTKAINKVHRWELFLLDLSFVPWYLLCLLTLGILFIWKLPYLSATYAHAYNYMVEDFTQRQARLQAILDQQRRQMGTMQ